MENYIKVNGKINTKIAINQNQAFEVLYQDLYSCCNNIDLSDKETKEIIKALKTVATSYSIFKSDEYPLIVDSVFDSECMCFKTTSRCVLEELYNKFDKFHSLTISKNTDSPKIRGVYSCNDISYHGSPIYEYSLEYPGVLAEKTFLALKYLNDNFISYINKNTHKNGNNMCKKIKKN